MLQVPTFTSIITAISNRSNVLGHPVLALSRFKNLIRHFGDKCPSVLCCMLNLDRFLKRQSAAKHFIQEGAELLIYHCQNWKKIQDRGQRSKWSSYDGRTETERPWARGCCGGLLPRPTASQRVPRHLAALFQITTSYQHHTMAAVAARYKTRSSRLASWHFLLVLRQKSYSGRWYFSFYKIYQNFDI